MVLDGAVLEDGCDWTGVELRGDLGGPDDVDLHIGGAGVAGGVELAASRLVGARLTGRRFGRLRLVDVVIEDCELSGVTIAEGHFTRVELRRCRMSGLVASTLTARHVRLTDCRADGAMFRMTRWDHAELRDVDLRGADFYGSDLTGARLLGCDLTAADLSKCTMAGAALHGSTLTDLRGADSLRGAVIAGDQVLQLALPVLVALGIVVDDARPD
jgi:uncharacterized protein YjbI with pentapeptide repeats